MKLVHVFGAAVLAAGFALGAMAQEEIKAQHVAGNIHMLEGSGGNVGVSAGEDGILIVDDKFEKDVPRIRELLQEIDPGPLKFVLNTHYHGDHTGGNAEFGDEAVIIAHENVRVRLAGEDKPKVALPVVTYEDKVTIHFNGETIDVIHFPEGHTDSDSIVFFRGANVVHMGDHMFAGRFPYIDLGGGGSVQGYIDNVAKALSHIPDDAKLIPGHGPLSTKADLQELHDMIDACYTSVKDQVAAGKSIEDIQEQGVPAEYKDWGWRFISEQRWIMILHEDATK